MELIKRWNIPYVRPTEWIFGVGIEFVMAYTLCLLVAVVAAVVVAAFALGARSRSGGTASAFDPNPSTV